MVGNLLAKGVSLLCVRNTKFKSARCQTAGPGSHVDPAHLNAIHHLVETTSGFTAQKTVGGQHQSIHDQFRGVDTLVAHFLDLARNRQTRENLTESGGLLDQEG